MTSNNPVPTGINVTVPSTWQETLKKSEAKRSEGAKQSKAARFLLWEGAQQAIGAWLPNSTDDVSGEVLYNDVKSAMGEHRKGDASKIKTVALAVKHNGLVLSVHPNLSKAYAEALRLTQTIKAEAEEDHAAEKAVQSIDVSTSTDLSTMTAEDIAKALFAKANGVDGAAVALLDALGATNEAAHKAFMRAVSSEIAGRVKAVPKKQAVSGPKAGATQAPKQGAGQSKPKAQPVAAKAKPTKAPSGAGVKKAQAPAPAKAKPEFSAKKAAPAAKASKPVAVKRPVSKPVKRG